MLLDRLLTAGIAALMTLMLIFPAAYMAYKSIPPTLATIDFTVLMKEEETRFSTQIQGEMDEHARSKLLQSVEQYGRRLSSEVDRLSQDCDCVLINKAVVLGKPTVQDLTNTLRTRMTQ